MHVRGLHDQACPWAARLGSIRFQAGHSTNQPNLAYVLYIYFVFRFIDAYLLFVVDLVSRVSYYAQ